MAVGRKGVVEAIFKFLQRDYTVVVDAQERGLLLEHQKSAYKLGLLDKLKLNLYTRYRNLNKYR